MKVFKFKCNACEEKTQTNSSLAVFKEGCPLCESKSITVLGYGVEELN